MLKTSQTAYTEAQVIEALSQVFKTQDFQLFAPMTSVVLPNFRIMRFRVEHEGNGLVLIDSTVQDVLVNISSADKVADFIFSHYSDYYSKLQNADSLIKSSMAWESASLVRLLVKRGFKINTRYDARVWQSDPIRVSAMLHEVLRYTAYGAMNHSIRHLTNAGASLFDKVEGKYIFDYLLETTDITDKIWFDRAAYKQGIEKPLALKERCRSLLFVYSLVNNRLNAEGDSEPIKKRISSALSIEPIRRLILDFTL
jgi:hypothetical protein